MRRVCASLLVLALVWSTLMAGCTSPATPTPTKGAEPAKAAPTKAAEPTKAAAPAKAPEPTKAAPTQLPPAAGKEEFPVKGKAITIVVPWGAGGSPDLGARILAAKLEPILGTPVQVVNKSGGGGQVGATEIAKAKPDGYTIGITMHPHTNTAYLDPSRGAAFDRSSFQPLAHLDFEPYPVGVLPASPYKTAKDLVDAAKANPGKIRIATPGILTGQHCGVIQWGKVAGVDFASVQFDSGAQVVNALLGGHTEAAAVGAGAVIEHYRAGSVRFVAVLDEQENKFFPGVQPLASQGWRVVWSSRYGLSAPAGTPKHVVDVLGNAIKKVVTEDQDYIEKMQRMARTPQFMDQAGYGSLWEKMDADLKPIVEQLTKK